MLQDDKAELISVVLCTCRKGVVVTLVENSEQFVVEKLSRGLGVAIPELKMKEGMIAPVDSQEWDPQSETQPDEQVPEESL